MVIQSNRTLGGIGAVLTVIGAVSSVSSLLRYAYPNTVAADVAFSAVASLFGFAAFVGFILFLVAMYGFSRDYGDHKIFSNIINGIIYTIIAAVIVGVIAIAAIFANLGTIFPSTSNMTPAQIQASVLTNLSPFFAAIGIVSLVYVVFIVRSFNLLSDKSQVPLFKTGARMLLAGALVTTVTWIVFAVLAASGSLSFDVLAAAAIPGGLVQDIGWVLLAMAFFRIEVPPAQTFTPAYASVAPGQVRYCTHCGTPNQLDAAYCTHCGQKMAA